MLRINNFKTQQHRHCYSHKKLTFSFCCSFDDILFRKCTYFSSFNKYTYVFQCLLLTLTAVTVKLSKSTACATVIRKKSLDVRHVGTFSQTPILKIAFLQLKSKVNLIKTTQIKLTFCFCYFFNDIFVWKSNTRRSCQCQTVKSVPNCCQLLQARISKTMSLLDARSSEISNYFLNLYKIRIASDILGFDVNKKPKWYHQLPRRVLLKIFGHFTEHELQIKIMPVRW